MQPKYIRIGQLASAPGRAGMLPVSAPTIWRWVKLGRFPAPIRLGPQITAWPLEAVDAFLAQRTTEGAQ
jgi:predicted DNA-binding transcriptional regulator AlpA